MPLRYTARQLAAMRDDALEAAMESEVEKAPAGSLADLGREACRRLRERDPRRNGTRAAYLRGLSRRAAQMAWWAHALFAGWLAVVALTMIDSTWAPDRNTAYRLLIAAACLLVGVVLLRWLFSGRWRFGPPE